MLAQVAPEVSAVLTLAAEALGGGLDPVGGAGQPHSQAFAVVTGRGERKRPRRPFVHALDCVCGVQVERQGLILGGYGQHLERDVQQHPEGAQGSRHQAGDVVTGDVFHHLAAEPQDLAFTVDDPDPENEVPCGPGVRSPGTGEAAGDGSA